MIYIHTRLQYKEMSPFMKRAVFSVRQFMQKPQHYSVQIYSLLQLY